MVTAAITVTFLLPNFITIRWLRSDTWLQKKVVDKLWFPKCPQAAHCNMFSQAENTGSSEKLIYLSVLQPLVIHTVTNQTNHVDCIVTVRYLCPYLIK